MRQFRQALTEPNGTLSTLQTLVVTCVSPT